jgi:hypothetical protein
LYIFLLSPIDISWYQLCIQLFTKSVLVMSPMGLGTKKDCVGEDKQQFIWHTDPGPSCETENSSLISKPHFKCVYIRKFNPFTDNLN